MRWPLFEGGGIRIGPTDEGALLDAELEFGNALL